MTIELIVGRRVKVRVDLEGFVRDIEAEVIELCPFNEFIGKILDAGTSTATQSYVGTQRAFKTSDVVSQEK